MNSDEVSCSRHEKRKEGRVGMRCTVDVTPRLFGDGGLATFSVVVRDISRSGMGFITHERMLVGLSLVCTLPCKSSTPVQVILTVRRTSEISKGLYVVGASFVLDEPKSSKPAKVSTPAGVGAM